MRLRSAVDKTNETDAVALSGNVVGTKASEVSQPSAPLDEKNKKRCKERDAKRHQLDLEKSFMPIRLEEAFASTLSLGDCFKERVDAEALILGMAEAADEHVEVKERSSDALVYRCNNKSCNYRTSIRALMVKETSTYVWRVNKIVPHDCTGVPRKRKTNYKGAQLAQVLARSSITGFTLAAARDMLREYAIGDLPDLFVWRTIQEANSKRCEQYVHQTSRLMQYSELINGSEVGEMRLHFDEDEKLYGFTFSPAAELKMAQSGRLPSCVFTDAARVSGLPFVANLFSTITMDVGHKLRPLAVSYLLDNESSRSWERHYEALRSALPHNYVAAGLLDVGDQDKGEVKAREQIMTSCHAFFCSLHRKKNVAKFCKGHARSQYESAIACPNMERLMTVVERFEPNLSTYVQGTPLRCQFPAAAVAEGLPFIGEHTSNPVESWNHAMTAAKVRCSPPFEAAIELVTYCVQKFHAHKGKALTWMHECPPRIMTIIDERDAHARALTEYNVRSNGSEGMYLVAHRNKPNATRLVNLREDPGSRCSCEREKIHDNLPACVHILACTLFDGSGEHIASLVPPKYTTRSWRETYEVVDERQIFAPPTADLMAKNAEPIDLPGRIKRGRGRPSAISLGKRQKAWHETGIKVRKKGVIGSAE